MIDETSMLKISIIIFLSAQINFEAKKLNFKRDAKLESINLKICDTFSAKAACHSKTN